MFIPIPLLVVGAIILVVVLVFASRRSPAQEADLLKPPTPLSLPPDTEREVRSLLRAGNKIEAIKLVREASGAGLAGAKQLVDKIEGEW